MREDFDSPTFARDYHNTEPLGAFCSASGTLFRLWAPTAEAVSLRLYERGDGGSAFQTIPLARERQGAWSATLPACGHGTYYDYLVTVDGTARAAADPYAHACGVNGKRSMVLDSPRTDPPGWREDVPPPRSAEDIIYELHIKDFSYDPASGVDPAWRGKYRAFCQERTTLYGDGQHGTCLRYLKELGVTHIQIMPSFDFASVDERGGAETYNWGYDPENYNIPEGSYATDPDRGEIRVREMKEMVQSLHKNGFRVILDVVFNHTHSLDACLWRTVPWYYYRRSADGSPANGSGCGNDLASERSMCARYILDSVLWWAEEYHIDGFRFDLMGLLDVDLMNRIQTALDARWGVGEKLVYGEPWAAAETAARPGTMLAGKENLRCLHGRIGAFCDATRDAIKGGLRNPKDAGFVNGGGLTAAALEPCLKGWAGAYAAFSVVSPAQTITYLSAHDDWTLWDKLRYTLGEDRETLLAANRLAAAINFCCQGHVFFLAGEEFGRTKNGVKNTYNAPAELNRLDWERAWEFHALVAYYQGLIALRKQLPGLCDKSARAGERFLWVRDVGENCAAALVDNRGGSPWRQLLLIFNAGSSACPVALPTGNWVWLADGESSFLWRTPIAGGKGITIPPSSAGILGQQSCDINA